MLRVKEELSFRVQGEENFSSIGMRVKLRGRGWRGKGEWSEHGERMEGTVLIRWERGYEEKLVVVTEMARERRQRSLVPDAFLGRRRVQRP